MPNKDCTGPHGKGPLTGRGFGKCNKDHKEETCNRQGKGRGCGRGRGRGRNNHENDE